MPLNWSERRARATAERHPRGERAIGTGALVILLIASPKLAHADDDTAACLTHHEQGQVSRSAGKFDAARDEFASCTADACPALVRKRCVALLAELDAAQPTVVVVVHDSDGRDVAQGLSMTLDGASPRDVPATALRLDPGEHTLRVTRGALLPVDRPFVVHEGEKDRRIDVVLGPETHVVPRSSRISTAARVWIGVSAVTLVAAGATSAIGWGIHTHLESSCSPRCTQSQVEPLRILWPVSGAALGVSAVSGAISLGLVLTHRAPSEASAGFQVTPAGVGWIF
jgi:hypothetical protein